MLCIINSLPKSKIIWVINLIAALSYQSWADLSEVNKQSYVDALGEEFILRI